MGTHRKAVRHGGLAATALLIATGAGVLAVSQSSSATAAPAVSRIARPVARQAAGDGIIPQAGISSVRVDDAGPRALKVSWPASVDAIRYRLSWADLGTGRAWTGSAPDYAASDSPVTLTGLEPGHTYQVGVAAVNDVGPGETAYAVRSTTRVATNGKPGGVSRISAVYAGPGALKLTWSQAPGASRYRISYTDEWTGRGPDGQLFAAGDSPATLTGLPIGHPLQVRVEPVTDVGAGPQSRVLVWTLDPATWGRPADVGDPQLSPAGATALALSWERTHGPVPDSQVRYRIGWTDTVTGRSWTSSGSDYGLADSPVTLTGLTTGHHYVVRITPYDQYGTGPTSTLQADVG